MKTSRYTTSRAKACKNCFRAKTKCDRAVGGCSRCVARGVDCVYPVIVSTSPVTSSGNSSNAIDNESRASETSLLAQVQGQDEEDPLDFTNLELVCPINAEEISNRWLHSYIPIPGQIAKDYPPNVAGFSYRMLKSYTTMTVRGRGIPPFIHWSQVAAEPANLLLGTCLSLVRICDRPLRGTEDAATEILQREMNSIFENYGTYDDMTLLAAFQAFLLYTMTLFFQLSQGPNPSLRHAMMNLQELAFLTSRQGLVCVAEQQRIRPGWESWIVAEAKRRTLFTMYLFDGVLTSEAGQPTFLGIELQGLLAPAAKSLWYTKLRYDWEAAYNFHLADWVEGGLCIDELWPIPAELDECGIMKRRTRVANWLEDLDEFGTMLYAVTSCTHGG
ncbi:hypothetical protein PT974_09865 [Cladobotryum mycophilum]|uniref:Zn(2)-C6 fungal-type domain-containing protein n=1 Tax=Cladobotryum mycophilum TaxID=491253 RepID=A0ABR0SIJ9_9HYPO